MCVSALTSRHFKENTPQPKANRMNPSIFEFDDGTRLGIGGVLGTFPWWGEIVVVATGASQLVMFLCGVAIAFLTIRNLILRNKIANRQLNEHEKKDD